MKTITVEIHEGTMNQLKVKANHLQLTVEAYVSHFLETNIQTLTEEELLVQLNQKVSTLENTIEKYSISNLELTKIFYEGVGI